MSFERLSTTGLKDKDMMEIKISNVKRINWIWFSYILTEKKKNNFKNISKCYSNENENKTQDGRKETVQILKLKKRRRI